MKGNVRVLWFSCVAAAALIVGGEPAHADKKSPSYLDIGNTWKAPVTREREAARDIAPGRLDLTPYGSPRAQPLVLRLRIYADKDFRGGVMRWQPKVRLQIERINHVVERLFGARFEIESLNAWERTHAGVALETVLDELQALDGARDVDWVLGLVTPFRGVATSIHHIGMAPYSSRHFVMRAMDDAEEGQELDRELSMLGQTERDKLYGDRKAHKELVIFLHEWAHSCGAMHVEDRAAIMNPQYSPKQVAFTDFEKQLIELVLSRRAADREAPFPETAELLRLVETAPREEGSDADRKSLRDFLASRSPAAPVAARAAARQPAAAPAGNDPLAQAIAKIRAGDLAGATPLVFEAARRASAGPPDADLLVRVAEAAASVGAFTTADAAIARAGKDAKHGAELAAEIEAERYRLALPHDAAKLGIAPEAEPRYVAAFQAALRAVQSRNHAVAEQRLAELAAGFPTSAGRDVIACELARLDKHLDEADRSCRAALTKDPGAVRAYVALGRMALQAGRKVEAEKHLRHAKMLDPMNRDVWQDLGQVYRAMGDKSKRSRLASEHEVVFHAPLPP